MNVFQFNKVIYKGNINIDFYLYCLKEDIKLIRFLFYNLFYFILSTIFNKYKDLYDKKKYKYLKYVKNLDIKIERFCQKNRYNNYINSNIDMIIDKVAKILIAKNISNKIIAYELDDNYEVKIDKYNKEVSKINKANYLYIRNRRQLININFNKLFIVNNNRLKYVYKREINGENLFIILVLSFILTCISFCYTNYVLYMPMIITYFEPKLFLLNFLPIFLFILLFYFITKRIHITFLINSLLVIALSIANQTKVLYRDDIVKFEDLTLFKEAIKMIERYSIIIRWYTIIFIVIIILIYFILKKYCKKYSIKSKKQVSIIILTIALISLGYKLLYTDEKLYDSLGDKSLINVYISTRQSQIRGLIYPFIYTINEAIDRKPENYDEKLAKDLLEKYEYEDIDENKKVNIIAIMLEAYNDFSKYGIIKFNEDIYQKLHTIQENSITGNLVTNIFGGNTVVTERNFLTGYTDFLSFRKNTNSYVWYLKE